MTDEWEQKEGSENKEGERVEWNIQFNSEVIESRINCMTQFWVQLTNAQDYDIFFAVTYFLNNLNINSGMCVLIAKWENDTNAYVRFNLKI